MVPLLEPAKGLIENSAFPVNYLSYSAIREYLKCPRSFLMKYVRHEFSFSTSKAMLIGSIAHRVIEMAIKQEQDYTKNMASLYEVLLATVAI